MPSAIAADKLPAYSRFARLRRSARSDRSTETLIFSVVPVRPALRFAVAIVLPG